MTSGRSKGEGRVGIPAQATAGRTRRRIPVCPRLRQVQEKANLGRLIMLLRERFVLPQPRITHPESRLALNQGYLLGGAGRGDPARPDL